MGRNGAAETMNKVLVTGGGGFIGTAIVRGLRARGIDCCVVGRNRYPEIEKLGAVCIRGDIRDRDFLTQCSKGVDTLFHVASLAAATPVVALSRACRIDPAERQQSSIFTPTSDPLRHVRN